VLGQADGAVLIHEPDNVRGDPSKTFAEVGQFPVLMGDEAAPRYAAVWDLAYSGGWPQSPRVRAAARMARLLPSSVVRQASRLVARGRRPGGPVIVKSVYSAFSIDWLARRYAPEVIVMRRHALSVVASWVALGFQPYASPPFRLEDDPWVRESLLSPYRLQPPEPDAPHIKHIAWTVGLLSAGYEAAIGRHPEWTVISHEEMCTEPTEAYQRLYARLSLPWSPATEQFLTESNRTGDGGTTHRVSKDQPGKWRRMLSDADAAGAIAILERFPLHPSALEGTGSTPAATIR
jgi:hypothetical protein